MQKIKTLQPVVEIHIDLISINYIHPYLKHHAIMH